jgi:aminoglycoside phosphotransferase (APT) family kinase protein
METVIGSITKNRQSAETLRAMVARAFGPERVSEGGDWFEELGHGWCNVAYRIGLRGGGPVVLKIAPPAGVEVMTYEKDMMRNEVSALRMIRERTRVPVPAVLHYDAGRELCDAEYFFMEFVEGDNLGVIESDLPKETYAAYMQALGAANRELNTIRGARFGPLPGDPHTADGVTWREVFTAVFEDVLRDGERRDVDLGWSYAAVRRLVTERADCLDEVTEPVFVERDLWTGNVIVRDGALAGIIDHERALYGDPLMEAGFAAVEPDALPGDPSGFLRGYGKGPFTETEHMRRRLYNLHFLLIMIIETAYRGYADSTQYDYARVQLARVLENFGLRR